MVVNLLWCENSEGKRIEKVKKEEDYILAYLDFMFCSSQEDSTVFVKSLLCVFIFFSILEKNTSGPIKL